MRKLLTLGVLLSAMAGAQDLPKVIEGKSGWLFINEELQRFGGTQNVYSEQLEAIAQVAAAFKDHGIQVVVVVAPTKASIYNEYIPDNLKVSLSYKTNYAKVMADLKHLGVQVVDVKAALLARKSEGLLYFKTDTHWTPLGMQIAAQSVNKSLISTLAIIPQIEI